MKHWLSTLFLLVATALFADAPYKTPFHVEKRTILDAENREVRLWGVNYYAPFNHNFFNMEELGVLHEQAIDRDLAHFKLLGVNMIRMHLYEREITDPVGNLVENRNLEVFDYLVDRCEKEGIFLMISPITWWNTIANMKVQDEQYSYWHVSSQRAFGFTNFHSIDAMIWDQDAIDAQVRYMEGLFQHKNRYSGKPLCQYRNIVAVELCNEPIYPRWDFTFPEPPDLVINQVNASFSHGAERQKFIDLWKKFRAKTPADIDDSRCFKEFSAQVMDNYFTTLRKVVDRNFGRNILNTQFCSYNGVMPADLQEAFDRAKVDVASAPTYCPEGVFDAVNNDGLEFLPHVRHYFDRLDRFPAGKQPLVIYEFDAVGTTVGYPIAAIAAQYARHHIQIANHFTYTPYDVAAWNPGWLVHFMNIAHTPAKALGFAIGGEIFRRFGPGMKLEMLPGKWVGDNWEIEHKGDRVLLKTNDFFGYTVANDWELPEMKTLRRVAGRFSSRFAESDGNGAYFLEKIGENQWKLDIFPEHKLLADPTRGRTYRYMANRYVNCQKEPPVSQLRNQRINFRLKALTLRSCTDGEGKAVEVKENGVEIVPGSYILHVK